MLLSDVRRIGRTALPLYLSMVAVSLSALVNTNTAALVLAALADGLQAVLGFGLTGLWGALAVANLAVVAGQGIAFRRAGQPLRHPAPS